MLTRRDLIHSRQYLRQRYLCAIVSHRADPLDWAGRNAGSAAFAGVMILVIALAGTAVLGKIFPGGSSAWNKCDAVIVERETGTKYVCGLQPDTLHPVLNFASAALIKGTTKQVTAARSSLTWPRGPMVGIPDAPDNLPGAGGLLVGAWNLCSVLRDDGSGTARPASVVLVGSGPAGARPADASAVVVADPDGGRHLIWQGARFPLTDARFVLSALGLTPEAGVPVAASWLAPLPLGPALGPIEVTGAGAAVPGLPSLRVGRFATVATADGTTRWYLAQAGGLQEVTEVQRSLVRTADRTPVALSPTDLTAPGVVIMPPMAYAGIQPPTRIPAYTTPSAKEQTVCAAYLGDTVGLTVDGTLPVAGARAVPAAARRPLAADAVLVEPGHGALIRALATPTAPAGTLMLVTDLGVRYACADDAAAQSLGYPRGTPIAVIPAGLLALLPQGPALDASAALRIFAHTAAG
ncbi:type VII secretion protein EccB [Allocatelliglobosispora scoriae]|uniref:Type VII secretion protein EccB n=1 Tax=Allocatelliglobosispora scoriae TaxID=643052 RepID=A0A841BIW4_9ACTN|nr:type VII secretion protein EccB [Allocatelliglobosispora scoriae]MBB5867555.1 type VII secretion protein EccB [Allocatelliglobosispora scoriae]